MPVQRASISLDEAQHAVNAILEEARRTPQQPIAVCVCDEAGELVAFARMDHCRPQPLQIARKKAYTAARTAQDTRSYGERLKTQGRSVSEFGDPMLLAVQGGLPVLDPANQRPIGGIGVSGRTAEEDDTLARAGLQAIGLR